MTAIEDILAKAKPRVEEVSICLAGDLRAEHAQLVTELERVIERQVTAGKMTGDSEARGIAEKVQLLEAEMEKASQPFRFRGASEETLEALRERFPPRDGKRESWNTTAAGPALIAACASDPAMSEAQADMLRKAISQGDWDLLVEAAWTATTSKDRSVPFSVRASVLTRNSA